MAARWRSPACTWRRGSRGCVVVAGDFQQLDAITAADTPAVRAWLKRNAFRVAGIPEMLAADEPPPYVAMLREQYRMAHAICDLVSEDSYLGQLCTAAARRAAPYTARRAVRSTWPS